MTFPLRITRKTTPLTLPNPTAREVCAEVIRWAQTPGNHGGNPYSHKFVQLALKVMAKK